MNAVEAKNISKNFETTKAVQNLTFSIGEGELFGFIGPDGAGKTTLFRMLTTLLIPDEGTAAVNRLDIVKDFRKLRTQIGYMPGRFSLYQDLTVEENLEFFATIFGTTLRENKHLIQDIYVQIEPFKDRKAGKLSGGMKQKLALCCALIHKPSILFLDEPTTGVDAVSRKEFWEMLHRLQKDGMTIIVSTPYMDEASQCDRVALIQNGKILGIDTPQGIIDEYKRPLLAVKASDTYHLILKLRAYPQAHSVFAFGEYLHYADRRPEVIPQEIEAHLQKEGFKNIEVKPVKATIEDAFMALVEEHGHE